MLSGPLLTFCLLAAVDTALPLEPVVDDLGDLRAVAVQPETGHPFVIDALAGRVVRVVDGKPEDAIVGLPLPAPDGTREAAGSLAFLDRQTLLVANGPGLKLLQFSVPPPGGRAVSADEPDAVLVLADEPAASGDGRFVSLAMNDAGVFAAARGQDWIAFARREANGVVELARYLDAQPAAAAAAPSALAFGSHGHLLVAQPGLDAGRAGTTLAFFNPNTRRLLLQLPADVHDVVALAYSPRSGQLYALDASTASPGGAGLFQLVQQLHGGRQTVDVRRVAALQRPTAMAFDADGTLFLTTAGPAPAQPSAGGQLLRLPAERLER